MVPTCAVIPWRASTSTRTAKKPAHIPAYNSHLTRLRSRQLHGAYFYGSNGLRLDHEPPLATHLIRTCYPRFLQSDFTSRDVDSYQTSFIRLAASIAAATHLFHWYWMIPLPVFLGMVGCQADGSPQPFLTIRNRGSPPRQSCRNRNHHN